MTEHHITKQLLKLETGEFDVESIHTLQLHNRGLTELGCIGDCAALERLDLSSNKLVSIKSVANLVNLVYLDISCNQITSLDGLQSLENLTILNAAGNLVSSLETLRIGLSGLVKLTDLRFVDAILHLTNPVSQNPLYQAAVLSIVPSLSRLDGVCVRGIGSGLSDQYLILDTLISQCREAVQGQHDSTQSSSTTDVKTLGPVVPNRRLPNTTVRVEEAEKFFLAEKMDCERVLRESGASL